jgi:hypothetical protein
MSNKLRSVVVLLVVEVKRQRHGHGPFGASRRIEGAKWLGMAIRST